MSVPSKRTFPDVGGSRYRAHLAIVVFPHPLSPTSPRVSPLFRTKDTLSTACTSPIFVLNRTPFSYTGKCLVRFLTSSVAWLVWNQLATGEMSFSSLAL